MIQSNNCPVITRFAPSPTGNLHIGGARTALFNWLLARANRGKMFLRIEDTDRERSDDVIIKTILEELVWLGLDWDGEVISQSSRIERHREIAEHLLFKGAAYKCYDSDQSWNHSGDENKTRPAIRLRSPLEGETIIQDSIQGKIRIPNKDLNDPILLRSGGMPTYMLAVVVDDHDMGITHIIRGDDHLINSAKQIIIYNYLGWDIPKMSHVPLIYGKDGKKLSKRHGSLGVKVYRAMGYLPNALRNYLLRLGWSYGNQEYFSQTQLDKIFNLSSIGKSPARFDLTKLKNMNGHYIRESDDESLLNAIESILPDLEKGAWIKNHWTQAGREKLLLAMPGLKKRAKTLLDLIDESRFIFYSCPLPMEEKAIVLLEANHKAGRCILSALVPRLSRLSIWSRKSLESEIKQFTDEKKLKLVQVAEPIRAALTGTITAIGIFDLLFILGRDESLSRFSDQLD
ncbi:glutamate--tRNA ligase [Candidatus Endowatersipora endosymbiont of Watersipora subatra]|uniref:glutamate--tRNA ligase n=1 Tax=Candidatus Endowatersipora endosymbiont of Watersipora subatra TaxID=3077946 RepID=UPI00312C964B